VGEIGLIAGLPFSFSAEPPMPPAARRRTVSKALTGLALLLAAAWAGRGHTAHAEFDWTRGETLATGVALVTTTLTKPPEAGLTCPQYAAFDPAAPRTVAIAAARIALGPGVRFEATPRAADWGRPMPPRGEQAFPDLVIRTSLQTVPAFAAAERAAGVPVVLAVNASPWEPFVPGKAFEHADRMGLVVDDGVVV
jgi:hypothetical protein